MCGSGTMRRCPLFRCDLRRGLSVDEGLDGLWGLTSLAVYDMVVTTRNWSVERYERWLADRLSGLLLS